MPACPSPNPNCMQQIAEQRSGQTSKNHTQLWHISATLSHCPANRPLFRNLVYSLPQVREIDTLAPHTPQAMQCNAIFKKRRILYKERGVGVQEGWGYGDAEYEYSSPTRPPSEECISEERCHPLEKKGYPSLGCYV